MTQRTNQKGFTLIELLITVAIVAILATIALPAYNQYRDRAKFAEVIHASEPAKTMVDVCVQTGSPLDNADPPQLNCGILVPDPGLWDGEAVNDVAIAGNPGGPWTVTVIPEPVTGYGFTADDTYVATGTLSATGNTVNWEKGGVCLTNGLC
ncbi:MAG: prepilin-type N-terminal cleavage/methylation domain-containing protein [Gammaproteobacteria bacterium]